MAGVLSLMATLGLDTSAFEQGLDQSSDEAQSFGDKLGSSILDAAKAGLEALEKIGETVVDLGKKFVGAVGDVAQFGDNIDKSSQKMGISAEAYQEWDFVLQHAGTSIDSMRMGMKALTTATASGNKAFEKLGISQEQVASMSKEDLFAATIKGLQGVSDETERATIAQDLFGRSAMEMGALLNMSAEETEAMLKQVHELGGVMSDEAVKASAQYQDSLQNLKTVFSGLKNNLLSEFLPGFSTVMDGLTNLFIGKEGGAASIVEGIYNIVDNMRDMAPKLAKRIKLTVKKILPALKVALQEIVKVIGDLLPMIGDLLTELLPIIMDALPGFITALLPALLTAIGQLVAAIVTNLPQILRALWDGLKAALGSLWTSLTDVFTGVNWGEVWETIKKKFDEWKQKLLEIDWEEVGTKLRTDILTAFETMGSWLHDIFTGATEGIESVDWSAVGTTIITNIKTGIGALWGTFYSLFGEGEQGVRTIDWAQLGEDIKNLVISAFDGLGSLLQSIYEGATEGIKAVNWFEVGKWIIDKVKEGIGALFGIFLDLFGDAEDGTLAIDWLGVGKSILDFIVSAFEGLASLFFGLFVGAVEGIFKVDWKYVGEVVWKKIKEGLGNLWQSFKDLFAGDDNAEGGVTNGVNWKEVGGKILEYILEGMNENAREDIKKVFEDARMGVIEAWQGATAWFKGIWDGIIADVEAFCLLLLSWFEAANNNVEKAWDGVVDWFQKKWDGIVSGVQGVFDNIMHWFMSARTAVWLIWKGIVDWFQDKWDRIVAAVENLPDEITKPFKDAKTTIIQAWQVATGFFSKIWDDISNNETLKTLLDIIGAPFTAAKEAAEAFGTAVQSLSNTIGGYLSTIKTAFDSFFAPIQSMIDNLSSAWSSFMGLFGGDTSGGSYGVGRSTSGGSYGVGRRKQASAYDTGHILHGLTPFGIDANGSIQYGGEVGDEAVVGVNSLNHMIQKSVASAFAAMQGTKDTQPVTVQLVLDTGVLLGEVDIGLNEIASWRGGGRA